MGTSEEVRGGVTPRSRVQRRTLTVLVAAQAMSGAGLTAGTTVGALLAQDMFGSTGPAGLPSAFGTAGSALAAAVVGRIAQTWGRRPGLVAGYATGAAGSLAVVVAGMLEQPLLLCAAMFVYGAGTSTNLYARYTGADLAEPAQRARAVSTVLVATTLGGIAGPALTTPVGDFARVIGLPELTGPFLLASAAYTAAAVILARWLRPDPLLLARARESGYCDAPAVSAELRPGASRRFEVFVGAAVLVVTQLVMVAAMTMTPVHLREHGNGSAAVGLVIAAHIAAMYLPSPLTGRLVDRYGRHVVAAFAGAVLAGAGAIAACESGDSVAVSGVALALLGFGWNLGLVAGTEGVTAAVSTVARARTQGAVDVAVAVAAAAGGAASGVVVAATGYSILASGGALLALMLIPLAAVAAGGFGPGRAIACRR